MSKKPTLVCSGSAMNGLDINLVEFCDLAPFSDKDHDKVCDYATDIVHFEECSKADCYAVEGEDIPRFSDTYYTIETDDLAGLKREMRELIISIIEE
jgi:hypothetical protein|tara:strand:+ start:302 stop:592 length:291 start_codon:yes stop_codon:yes gene_type:complete